MKVRSKHYFLLYYGTYEKAYISVYPQQRWEVNIVKDKVQLSRKGITLEIKKEDLKRLFVECEVKECGTDERV